MKETSKKDLEKKLSVLNGRYWWPLAGPFVMMNDFSKGKMVKLKKQIDDGVLSKTTGGIVGVTYYAWHATCYLGTGVGILYGLSNI